MSAVKCLVWDLDGTAWPGVAIEGPEGVLPRVYPRALAAMRTLAGRGIVSSAASRTDPTLTDAVLAHPELSELLVAPQLGWGAKSEALVRIADALGIGLDTVAFVDDTAFERAEVAAMLPEVLVLSPEQLYERLDGPDFTPAILTAESARRTRRYRQDTDRRAARERFAGSREEFLRASDFVLTLSAATASDVPRVAELAERTHRFNTTGQAWPAERIAELVADPGWFVPVARLTDRYGDYGLIATALVERHPGDAPVWAPRLFMVSCRAAGREIPRAFLGWLMRRATADGARRLVVDLRPTGANLELRMLLRATGFTAADPALGTPADGLVSLSRPLDDESPSVEWLRLVEQDSQP